MSVPSDKLPPTTRPLHPSVRATLAKLVPGQRIRITHMVRVGNIAWPVMVTGSFRALRALVTGLATDRVPEDDVIVPTVHFTKDNEELSSVTLDENCRIEIISIDSRPKDAREGPTI
jgi:hypothetical protein